MTPNMIKSLTANPYEFKFIKNSDSEWQACRRNTSNYL